MIFLSIPYVGSTELLVDLEPHIGIQKGSLPSLTGTIGDHSGPIRDYCGLVVLFSPVRLPLGRLLISTLL